MNPHALRRVQLLPRSIDEVFSFFQSPENLSSITPSWLAFQIITPLPLKMKEGMLIDYVVRWFGLPLRWTTLITTNDPPHRFVDEQIRGPYSFWHHTHEFRSTGSGTEMTDTVRYLLPVGPLGEVVHTVLVRRQLERIFDYRAEVIARHFQSDTVREQSR